MHGGVYVYAHVFVCVGCVFMYVSISSYICICVDVLVYMCMCMHMSISGLVGWGHAYAFFIFLSVLLACNMVMLNVPCYYVLFWELWENVIITLESKILFPGNCRASWWTQVYHINSQNNIPLSRPYISLRLPSVVWRKWIPKGMALLEGVALMQ